MLNLDKIIEKGEYLAKLGDCIACHTKDHDKPYSGGLGIYTPFGTFYAPNITPDKKFGIGGWTLEEFTNALRHGKAPDGSNYFPVFPYLYYNRITDDDMKALKAYFDAIPAISEPSQEHEVGFPFNIRFLQYFWKILFFYPYEGVYTPDMTKSEKWNRGAYIVEGLAHCGMCHTPINFMGGPKRHLAYTGNIIDGWKAPNITGTQLKRVSEDKLVRLFLYDERISGHGKLAEDSPMRLVNHDSLEYIATDDLKAIGNYLKTTVDPNPIKTLSKNASKEQKAIYTYKNRCAGCHDIGAGGAPKKGDPSQWGEITQSKSKKQLYLNAINGYGSMPARGLCASEQDPGCTDEDISYAVDYIIQSSVSKTLVKKTLGKKPKVFNMKDGEKIYQENCSSCHSNKNSRSPQLGDMDAWKSRIAKGTDMLILGALYGKSSDIVDGCAVIKGNCDHCSDAEIIAATKYIIQNSQEGKDFTLW